MSETNRYDVIIIGAGMSGLAAGIRLAYYEKKVLILEQHALPGGLNSYYFRKGKIFDVGLHALTNYVPKNKRRAPLNKLLRQLKLKWEDFSLIPQDFSLIKFPEVTLKFANTPEILKEEIATYFPGAIDGFNKLVDYIENYDPFSLEYKGFTSTREVLSRFIKETLLIEMLLCPLMYYGSAWEQDIDFSQFVIMFRSIFLEGFSRPTDGVIRIINLLKDKYITCGGELKFKAQVSEIITKDGQAFGVKLKNGEELLADKILSSAGLCETYGLLPDKSRLKKFLPGELSFTEVILLLKHYLSDEGHRSAIIFYNDSKQFQYEKCNDFVGLESGVICSPDNFAYKEGMVRPAPILRITNIANHQLWNKCDSKEIYQNKKDEWLAKIMAQLKTKVPLKDDNVDYIDMFTPKTVEKFTGHLHGAVYGSPQKIKDGQTEVKNLYICGTDQGFLGIIGALLSGVSMANLHCLKE
ncbi:phytoene desaturase family protein [Candidatus Auribacterota bacterium]